MNCSRCSTELADNATFCPKCGLSTTQGPPRSFSYLPPGAPPWPTSIPAQISYVVNSTAAPLPVAPPPKTESKSSSRAVLTGVIVLLLVPLLGALATFGILKLHPAQASTTTNKTYVAPTATPSAAQTPSNALPTPTAFTDTTDSDNSTTQMSLKYPSDWQKQPLTQSSSFSGLSVYSSQSGIEVHVGHYTSAITAQASSANDINQAVLQGLTTNYTSVQPVDPANAAPTIAGTQWSESDATYINSQISTTAKQHFAIITTKHNGLYYAILLFIPNSVYQDAMQKYIQPMLDSIKFLA